MLEFHAGRGWTDSGVGVTQFLKKCIAMVKFVEGTQGKNSGSVVNH